MEVRGASAQIIPHTQFRANFAGALSVARSPATAAERHASVQWEHAEPVGPPVLKYSAYLKAASSPQPAPNPETDPVAIWDANQKLDVRL